MLKAPSCVTCGGPVLILPPGKSSLCGSCVLARAFEPCEPFVGTTGPSPSWDGDMPVFGPYALVEEIGRGGMGVIYRAIHRQTYEVVALKTILPALAADIEILARFQREAEMARSFDHPHTMPILEVGRTEEGLPFFTMPLALGGGLHHLNAKYRGRWRRIAELMVKVAGAVHHAHHRGVLHRDLKPGNILFTENHEPLVADFGLAKPLTGSDDLTRSCALLGTPNYVAPEQAAGKTRELSAATDIYSLGAVLFELLTGRPPFVGDNPLEVLEQIGRKAPVRPRLLVATVPEPLERICMRCLEQAPYERYASAQAVAEDLQRWLDGRPVQTRSTRFRLRSSMVRLSAPAIIGAAIIALLTSGWMAWSGSRRAAASTPTTTTMAVVVDSFDQATGSLQMYELVDAGLRHELSESSTFSLLDREGARANPSTLVLDPLKQGRTAQAQTVLVVSLRQTDKELHLVTQFMRCDTGDTIWKRRSVYPLEQVTAGMTRMIKDLVGGMKQSWTESLEGHHAIDSPSLEAQTFYTRAMELAAHGNRSDLEAAIDLFQRAYALDPHFVQDLAMLAFAKWTMGNTYGQLDQFPVAESLARAALALDPGSAQAHRVVASCYFQQLRLDEAKEEFETAAELDPRSAGCCQSLALCLCQMGHPELAIPWLQRAVRIDPAQGVHSGCLGEVFALCGLDEQADEAMSHTVVLTPEKPDTQFVLVTLRVWQGRYDQARRLCTVARNRFPEYRYALNFAAWIEFCDDRLPEARGFYETLRAGGAYQRQWMFHGGINPASALAYIARQTGSFEEAHNFAEEAFRMDRQLLAEHPRNNRVLHDLAATYAVVGDEQNALFYLEQAINAGWAEHRSTRVDPRFDTLTHLPAFEALLERTEPKYTANTAQ